MRSFFVGSVRRFLAHEPIHPLAHVLALFPDFSPSLLGSVCLLSSIIVYRTLGNILERESASQASASAVQLSITSLFSCRRPFSSSMLSSFFGFNLFGESSDLHFFSPTFLLRLWFVQILSLGFVLHLCFRA